MTAAFAHRKGRPVQPDNEEMFPLVAGVVGHDREPVDPLLEAAAHTLRTMGYRVGGFVQEERIADGCCAATYLRDVEDGRSVLITQILGAGAKGCRLDPQRLAEASVGLLDSLDGGIDLLVLNRFGKDEAEGRGFRAVIEKALGMGIPVLFGVREAYAPAMRDFAGDYGTTLAPDEAAITAWCVDVLGRREGVAAEGEKTAA
jgi:nucleoside-triphosphatase THEP1